MIVLAINGLEYIGDMVIRMRVARGFIPRIHYAFDTIFDFHNNSKTQLR